MQKIAALKNGLCLSEEYVNANTDLLWQCQQSHQFYKKYMNVYLGRWCPECKKSKVYSDEIISKARNLYINLGLNPNQITKILEINSYGMVNYWVKKYKWEKSEN